MASKFKVGDVVFLKSGGPAMTVAADETINESYGHVCRTGWFDGGEYKEARFPETVLELVSEADVDSEEDPRCIHQIVQDAIDETLDGIFTEDQVQ